MTHYIPKTTPFAHQTKAGRAAHGRPGYAYLMEMGTGKTKVAIDEIGEYFTDDIVEGAMIFAPKGVYRNWTEIEIPTHMPDALRGMCDIVAWNEGGRDYRRKLETLMTPNGRFKILVMNIEALSSGKTGIAFAKEFVQSQDRMIGIVDESTFIKNPRANRTDAVISIGRLCSYRRILTGSPVTRSPLDLYSQFEFLGQGMLGFSSFYSYRARYAVMKQQIFGGRKVQLVVGFQNVDDLTKRIGPHSFRVTKEECLDLPPKVYVKRDVEMTEEQIRLYTEIKKNATAALNELTHVTATDVIVQILRLHQILCGHVKDELGFEHDVPTKRIDALLDVIEESSGKMIIWSRYRRDIDKIVQAISDKYGAESVVQYHGGVDGGDRVTAVDRFQKDDTCRFFVANTQTGGYGVTLTAASTVVYYSSDYDLEKRLQSEDRAHRSGQTKSVTYVDLICPGTIEDKILKSLRKKIDISSTVMGDDYREWII